MWISWTQRTGSRVPTTHLQNLHKTSISLRYGAIITVCFFRPDDRRYWRIWVLLYEFVLLLVEFQLVYKRLGPDSSSVMTGFVLESRWISLVKSRVNDHWCTQLTTLAQLYIRLQYLSNHNLSKCKIHPILKHRCYSSLDISRVVLELLAGYTMASGHSLLISPTRSIVIFW
jgi:hypothetical protein